MTVTDADLVLGILNPDRPLAGGLKLDFDAAYEGVAALGRSLGLEPLVCAAGIVEIVDSRMEDLIRRVTVQRGQDPRSFVLWGYGGASGAHAGLYGKGIGVREVVFPLGNVASVWSAYGLPQLARLKTFAKNVHFQTPFDLEQRVGLTDGNIRHLDITAAQMLARRPGYRSPIDGLYLCGAGTHPGGEVTGAPGHNAARTALRDLQA